MPPFGKSFHRMMPKSKILRENSALKRAGSPSRNHSRMMGWTISLAISRQMHQKARTRVGNERETTKTGCPQRGGKLPLNRSGHGE